MAFSLIARVLYCNNNNIAASSFIMFEVVFGPGKLGIRLRSRPTILCDGQQATECTYFDQVDDDDMTITGPGKRIALFQREPTLLAVNGTSVIGLEYHQVRKVLEEATRPLVIRCQIGVAPSVMSGLLSPSRRSRETMNEREMVPLCLQQSMVITSEEDLKQLEASLQDQEVRQQITSQNSEISLSAELEEKEKNNGPSENKDKEEPLEIRFSDNPSNVFSPILPTPSEEDGAQVRRYYNRVVHSPLSESMKEDGSASASVDADGEGEGEGETTMNEQSSDMKVG